MNGVSAIVSGAGFISNDLCLCLTQNRTMHNPINNMNKTVGMTTDRATITPLLTASEGSVVATKMEGDTIADVPAQHEN